MTDRVVDIEFLECPDSSVLSEINTLLPDLSKRYDAQPVGMPALEAVSVSDSDLLLARHTGRLVGMATIGYFDTLGGRQAWLNDMVVGSEYQHKGYGGQLLHAVFDRASSRGADRIGWTSSWSRKSAHGLYLRNGASLRNSAVFNKNL